ncbi:MAG: hypothetical protein KJO80_06580, partial [Gammaproteobacteria bacterium]|nr:hypothetical protein [Gammaproteobacteria bacterium]
DQILFCSETHRMALEVCGATLSIFREAAPETHGLLLLRTNNPGEMLFNGVLIFPTFPTHC